MTAVRAALVAMMCVGVGSLMHEQGTYALFAAQATNQANTFQVGTLKMSNSRVGNALFSTSTGDGVVNPGTDVTTAGGTHVFAPLNPSMASYASPTLPGATPPILPNNPGFSVNDTGGIAPGMMLVNSVTVGNVGTLSAGRVRLTVPSITLTNNQVANCDPSNRLMVTATKDVCGLGRLTDVLRVTAFYLAGEGRAVCVLGGPGLQGRVVAATNDGEAIAACAGPTLGASLVVAADGNGTFALAEGSTPTTIVAGSTSGDRISPALVSGIIVKNYRDGGVVDDWESGRQRAITFAVAFDPAADNRYQGARASVDIKWDSTSLIGAPAGGVDTGVVVGSGTVSGTLFAPGIGVVANVSLVPMTANGQGYGGGWAATKAGEGGAFTFANVAPGNYAVTSVVDDVPVYRTISVNAGATTTVALEASPVVTRIVTISPAGAATGTWIVEVGVVTGNGDANGVYSTPVGFGVQSQPVTNNTLSVKYRPADVSTTSVMIRKETAPRLSFQTPMSWFLVNGTVTVPTVSVSNWSCTGQTCTAAVGVSPTANGWFNATLSRDGFNLASNGSIYDGSGSTTFSTAATGTFNLDVTANLNPQDGIIGSPVTVTKQVTIPATPQ
ncbi:MAG: hypothetical protein NTX54_05830 [Chloroflexi bacterium]|nr:hypothetical protein [Chloroflexota bacterium]